MSVRVVILDDWEQVALGLADWSSLGADVEVRAVTRALTNAEDLLSEIADADVVVAMRERTRFPAEIIEALPALRLLITTGPSNAAIDLEACRRRGIVVCGTRSYPGGAAEITWTLILAAARRLDRVLPAMRDGAWPSTPGLALHGRTLGLLGLGRVGAQVARVGAAFGMEVRAWSPTLTPERAAQAGATAASFDEVLADADVLSLHLALNDDTRGIIGTRALDLVRPTTWLVNSARAGLVDDEALGAALASGRLAGAALDVFPTEPLPADSSLRTHPNLILTPHLGYVTDAGFECWFADVGADIVAWRAGSPIRVVE